MIHFENVSPPLLLGHHQKEIGRQDSLAREVKKDRHPDDKAVMDLEVPAMTAQSPKDVFPFQRLPTEIQDLILVLAVTPSSIISYRGGLPLMDPKPGAFSQLMSTTCDHWT